MSFAVLIRRNLRHFWRTNLAVIAGVTATVAVLAGALLVGDSVRASLRDLVALRLGRTTHLVTNENFFRAQLAEDLGAQPAISGTAPLIVLEGSLTHEPSGRSASSVQVYGVDERFWRFHQRDGEGQLAPQGREALLSPALAREFAASPGDALLLRVQRPADVPVESLHGRRDRLGRTIRLNVKSTLDAKHLGEFSLRPQQGEVRGVFVPLDRLQRDLGLTGRANTILISSAAPGATGGSSPDPAVATIQQSLHSALALDDADLTVRPIGKGISVESRQILLRDAAAATVQHAAAVMQWQTQPLFTYLANTIRAGSREIPYSLVTAADDALLRSFGAPRAASNSAKPPLWLNDWAARDLSVRPGETIALEYYVWQEGAGLRTGHAEFTLAGIVPIAPLNADRALAPDFPGIADTKSVSDWDPPFPVDLRRVRPRDEDYWDRYRTTPKALIRLEDGQRLWSSRYGRLTAIRLVPPAGANLTTASEEFSTRLRDALDPAAVGFAVVAVRTQGEAASQGAVNFGEYFVYFSFFLVVSAVLLAGLFFRLGIEQRLREIGLLRAVGFDGRRIASLFLAEGAMLSLLGSLLGLAGAWGYGALMVHGLRTWWVGAIGTTLLELHVSPVSLAFGGLGGIAAALVAIWWTLRSVRRVSPVRLLAGGRDFAAEAAPRRLRAAPAYGIASAILGLALLAAAAAQLIDQVGGFFGAGFLLLLALLFFHWTWLAGKQKTALAGAGLAGVSGLGLRNASWRPGRSLLCIALIASATFIIVAVDSFRRDGAASLDPHSGTGGYALLAESLLPIPYDLNQPAGREALAVTELPGGLDFVSFRFRPGEDVSCLNLYQPQKPKLLGVPASFVTANRMSFQGSVAATPSEHENPWALLDSNSSDQHIPAIVDANSLTYVLHKKLGDEIVLPDVRDPATGASTRLRLVAALQDSIFQSEVLVSEKNFLRLFAGEPAASGYRVFLISAPPAQAGRVTARLEQSLSDFGFDVVSTADRLAAFHRVENTYLSTFQALGGLGLLLGTVGLAAVLLRNVLERRRELALLRAVGYRKADLTLLVLAENALLLLTGLASGIATALLAITPALAERGSLPAVSFTLLGIVLLVGFAASMAAVAAVVRAPLLAALRSE